MMQGLNAITDSKLISDANFIHSVELAIIGGARIIQYRNKQSDQHVEQAIAVKKLCQKYKIPLIINDNIQLAQQIKADGVHLGKEDSDLAIARNMLGEKAIIGISCYNKISLAQDAVAKGASYVAFGSFFSSTTKPQATPCEISILQQARKNLTCPIVAIGGITPSNGSDLIAAGADCLAVINGVFGQDDITAAAQKYAQLF
ncbi:thiamine phosphate synthase [Candidatus Halobeggiatoa sp. HSG11]|nr:thiamine phosphate synthase [Candidatus Halobeggiatoa sp. HSG11]